MKNAKPDPAKSREFYRSYLIPVLLLLALGLSVVFLGFYAAKDSNFSEGSPSPRTYWALASMRYADLAATEKLRTMAEESIAGVVLRDVAAPERMRSRFETLRSKNPQDWGPRNGEGFFQKELLEAFGVLPEARRRTLLTVAGEVGDAYFKKTVSEDIAGGLDKALLWQEIAALQLQPAEENLLYQLLIAVIDPSVKIDPQRTAAIRDDAKASIPAVERRLEIGDVIVEQDEIVTPQIARLLRLQGYTEDEFPLKQLVIACLLILVLPLWLEIPIRKAADDRPSWGSIVFVIGIGWIFQTLAAHLETAGAGILPSVVVAYLCMPRRFAFNVCLVGVVSGAFLITGLPVYNTLLLLISGFVALMIGFYALHRIGSREVLVYKVLVLTGFLAVIRLIILSFQGFPLTWATLRLGWPLGETWGILARFVLFDLATTFLMVSLLPIIEGWIGALSVLKTRELSHPSSPLLKKLQTEAPGTYHHCLMIGTLAEAVAQELGMDENLMKVGAYYHDIGKLRRPRFFVENQLGGENIHDTMSPTLSTVALIAHVRDGVELAGEFHLPKKVRQFITEHHGTTCINYFYRKARALGENVEKEQFCYPGPKPQSRETALLMLLDSTEAAMRAESKNITTVDDIREIIARVFAIKIAEGQLDEANFTLREMTRSREALLKAFQSMYHTRKVKEIKESKG